MLNAATESLAEMIRMNNATSKELASTTARMKELETAVLEAEQQLAVARASNTIQLIPERSQTTKQAVLVTVSRNQIAIQAFDTGEKKEIAGRENRLSQLSEALATFSPLDHYMVFFIKPSAFQEFETVIDVARKGRFDVGYDPIGEDVNIEFGRP
jgi:hypothetical protein